MPRKIDKDRTYGQKLISLFANLLFSGESHSLTELSKMLQCSKQTVLRLVNDISLTYNILIEESKQGNRNYYRIKRLGRIPATLSLNEIELSVFYIYWIAYFDAELRKSRK